MTLAITCSPRVDVLSAMRVHARVPPLVIIVLSLTLLVALVFAPCFVGAAEKARTSKVRGIMRTVQIAAESYAVVAGKYPASLSDLEPFLPTGSNRVGGASGAWPENPFGKQVACCVFAQSLKNAVQVSTLRGRMPTRTGLSIGQVSYSCIDGGAAYAVVGTDHSGQYVAGTSGRILVLSNF